MLDRPPSLITQLFVPTPENPLLEFILQNRPEDDSKAGTLRDVSHTRNLWLIF